MIRMHYQQRNRLQTTRLDSTHGKVKAILLGKVKANLLQGLAAQQLQQTALVPQKKGRESFRGGLKYIVGLDGEAPKMAVIHCAFAEMAANEMRGIMGTTG